MVSDHLKRAAKHLPRFATLLKAAPRLPPPEVAYLLFWYNELRSRAARGMHVEPVQYSEVQAYNALFDLRMDSFDIETLTHLDALWLKSVPKPKSGSDK